MDLYVEVHFFSSKDQAGDLMEYVHRKAWAAGDGKTRPMKKADFEEALAEGKNFEIIDVVRLEAKGNKGKNRACVQERQAAPAVIEALLVGHSECRLECGVNTQ